MFSFYFDRVDMCRGQLDSVKYANFDVFNLSIPVAVPNVPAELLNPSNVWADKVAYAATVNKLALLFQENFKPYAAVAKPDVVKAGPVIVG